MVAYNMSLVSSAPRFFPVKRNQRMEMKPYQELFLVAHERWR